VALAVAAALGLVLSRRGRRPVGVAGLGVAGAFLWAMHATGRLVPGLPLALGLLALAGLVAVDLARFPPLLAVLAAPGAWVLATHAGLGEPAWLRAVLGVTVAVGAALAADVDRRAAGLGLGPVWFAVGAVGVLFTVGDTDVALALAPIAVLVAATAWPWPLTRLGGGGSAAAVGALAWVAAVGGVGRRSAVVGGLACLGLLIAEPLGRLLVTPLTRRAARTVRPGRSEGGGRTGRGRAGGRHRRAGPGPARIRLPAAVAAGLAQLVVVYVASRVAGVRHQVRPALVIAGADLAVATVLAAVWALRHPGRPARHRAAVASR